MKLFLTRALQAGAIVACALAVQDSAKAATIFDLVSPTSTTDTVYSIVKDGIKLTATPVGTSPVFNVNSNGLCVFSNRTGCGIPAASTDTIDQVQFVFDKDVVITGYSISVVNICGLGCTPSSNADFSTSVTPPGSTSPNFSFGQGDPGFGTPANVTVAPYYLTAGSAVNFSTNVIQNPSTGFQYRISSISTVPGPLPVVGAAVAFAYSKKLRSRIRQSSQLLNQTMV